MTATVAGQNTDRDLDGPLPAGRKMIRSGISWLDVEDTGGPKRPPVAPGGTDPTGMFDVTSTLGMLSLASSFSSSRIGQVSIGQSAVNDLFNTLYGTAGPSILNPKGGIDAFTEIVISVLIDLNTLLDPPGGPQGVASYVPVVSDLWTAFAHIRQGNLFAATLFTGSAGIDLFTAGGGLGAKTYLLGLTKHMLTGFIANVAVAGIVYSAGMMLNGQANYEAAIGPIEEMDPADIRYSQPVISQNFSSGYKDLNEMVADLVVHPEHAQNIEPIRVFEKDGKLWTMDNRRLAGFKSAGIERIPVVRIDPNHPSVANRIDVRLNPIDGEGWKIVVANGGVNSRAQNEARDILRQLGKIL